MIKTQNLTPQVYYNKSRDFQLLGRAYDIVFNYLKNNTNLMLNNPLSDSIDETLLDLITLTLGFKSKHNYNSKQLIAMCSAFMSILKIKGTKLSIETALSTLLQVEDIIDVGYVDMDYINHNVIIYIPSQLRDTNLLRDLLTYILPAGLSCSIIKQQLVTLDPVTTLSKTTQDYRKVISKTGIKSIIPKYSDFVESGELNVEQAGTQAGIIDNSTIVPYESDE